MKVITAGEFRDEVKKYYEEKEGIDIEFDFINISYQYTYFDYDYRIINLDTKAFRHSQEQVTRYALAHIPCIYDKGATSNWDYGTYLKYNSMVIDKVFDIGTSRNFDYSEVTSVLEEKIPDGFRIMPDSDISEVIKRMGFDEYNFSFIKLGSLEDGRIIFEVEVSNKNKSLKR